MASSLKRIPFHENSQLRGTSVMRVRSRESSEVVEQQSSVLLRHTAIQEVKTDSIR